MSDLISLARAAYYNLFIDAYEKHGAPTDRWLEEAGLPASLGEDPEAMIASTGALTLVRRAEAEIGVPHLSCDAIRSMRPGVFGPVMSAGIGSSTTVMEALVVWIRNASTEGRGQRFRLELTRPKYARVYSDVPRERQSYQVNLMQNWIIIQIVRHFVGPHWCPAELAFQSDLPPDGHIYDDLRSTQFFSRPDAFLDKYSKGIAGPESPVSVIRSLRGRNFDGP